MQKRLTFSSWQDKWVIGRYKDWKGLYLFIQKIRYRVITINKFKILEFKVLEHLPQKANNNQEEYKKVQPHLIGNHYLSLIDKYNKDIFWLQGNLNIRRRYRFFYDDDDEGHFKDFASYKKAVKEFNKVLKGNLKIELAL